MALGGDTALWLYNKLGTSSDTWTGSSIVSQLSPSVLIDVKNCFRGLHTQVKIKFLLAILQINYRNLEIWRNELIGVIAVAKDDSEPWVSMIAEIIKTFPETGKLNENVSYPEGNAKLFTDLVNDLKKALGNISNEKGSHNLPLECAFLNKNAFLSKVGSEPMVKPHFTLKKKPKASALREELLKKAEETQKKLKSVDVHTGLGTFATRKPTMPRKMGESIESALKPKPFGNQILNRNPKLAQVGKSDPKKGQGLKLLDITEQPLGRAALKHRKKQDVEDAKRLAAEAKASRLAQIQAEKERQQLQRRHEKLQAKQQREEEKMQAKLVSKQVRLEKRQVSGNADVLSSANVTMDENFMTDGSNHLMIDSFTPSAAYMSNLSTDLKINDQSTFSTDIPAGTRLIALPPQQGIIAPISSVNSEFQSMSYVRQTSNPASLLIKPIGVAPNSLLQREALNPERLPEPANMTPIPAISEHYTSMSGTMSQFATSNNSASTNLIPIHNSNTFPSMTSNPNNQTVSISQTLQHPTLPKLTPNIPSSNSNVQKHTGLTLPSQRIISGNTSHPPNSSGKGLTLTKEQMLEAQEMFSSANRVTRPEKALMLGFMAGSRENPCPQLGHVVTIKIAEHQENVYQADGSYLTMIVDTHFQMNYQSGEWKRLKSYRNIPQEGSS